MAKRDPEKTKRNRRIAELTEELNDLRPEVLEITGCDSEYSLHGKIGSKNALFIDVKQAVIHTPEQYVSLWMEGCMRHLDEQKEELGYCSSAIERLVRLLQKEPKVYEYQMKFLQRTFLREFENLTKIRPPDDAALWMGQNDAHFGLLVTPRYKTKTGWENDRSEIRRFTPDYWTIGHILETGLVVPDEPEYIPFDDVEALLTFYRNVLVRHTKSKHQLAIADRYRDFVRESDEPMKVPFLIPELRYLGRERKHEYRLDFCVVHPYTMQKVGFELSPWSSHGELSGIRNKTQIQVNNEARGNFEREMKKHKDYFRRHGITVLIYTDEDLKDVDAVFADIKKQLLTSKKYVQLMLTTKDQFMEYEP